MTQLKKLFLIFIYSFCPVFLFGQGKAHNFLLGYNNQTDQYTTSGKARLVFSDTSVTLLQESRKMEFSATQANISDENGNILIASNGCWIADATGDTMQNGNGLNPNSFTNDYCGQYPEGLPLAHGNIILPYPDYPDKYILFHQTGNYNANLVSTELYYSEIDLSLNSGLGAVTAKNQIILNDNLSWGLAACKHANGRDWWIVALRDYSTIIHTFLLDPTGITDMGLQNLGFTQPFNYNSTQPIFSPDGTKFVYGFGQGGTNPFHDIRLFNFDRCSGSFTGLEYIAINDSSTGFGFAFSPDSKYLYHSTFQQIYQFNTDTSDINSSKTIVATYDGFYSPVFPFATRFWYMYLSANGKIYISPGSGVVDLHFINYPDSAGLACNVQQHALHLPCYSFRGNVYHPNYYLGCDTTSGCPCLTTSINELQQHDFKFSISPNPTNGNIKIVYLLPQNKRGMFEVYDVNCSRVFSQVLPPWSTLQTILLPELANGIYSCVIESEGQRAYRKIAVVR